MKKKENKKQWFMLVELSDELKRDLTAVAKKRDWSLRKAAKHAIAAYVQSELKQ